MSRTGPHPEPFHSWKDDALASIEACVSALLASSETLDPDSPAAVAFNRAMRRFGEQAFAIGGAAALDDLRLRLVDEAPDYAVVRRAMLIAAWTGLAE
jgi:hypothetical protein